MQRFGEDATLEMEFPCDFPIKVAGKSHDAFSVVVCEIAARHDSEFTAACVQYKQSSTGKYQSLTLQIRATSKEQINAIYQDLKTCEHVLWAL